MSYQQSKRVDDYIARSDAEVQRRLEKLRKAIQSTLPKTVEDISYGIPSYRPAPKKRGLVHFGFTKQHIGLYGIFDPKSNAPIHEKMQKFRTGKGTLQFRNDEPFPIATIRQILAYHAAYLAENGFTN